MSTRADSGRHRAVVETSRGWRIAREKQAHKIDVVVALAQAALGAVKQATRGQGLFVLDLAEFDRRQAAGVVGRAAP